MLLSTVSTVRLLFLVTCLTTFSDVNGCGVIPAGREKTVNFHVTGFKLPVKMAYSEDAAVRMKANNLSASRNEAETFVQRLIMQPVKDVLYEQGRSAFLADSVISLILQQFDVQISYEPLKCENVIDAMGNGAMGMMKTECVVVDNTITNICRDMMMVNCMPPMLATNIKDVPPMHLSISGNLKTSNSIMANWSNQMWTSVLNRVFRKITSGQYASYFYGASVNIN